MEQEVLAGQEDIQVIAFKLGNEEYGIPIMDIQEIIIPQETTRIPKLPDFIEGVINLRGSIIPIIDGRKRFGLKVSDIDSESRVMVIETNNHTIGLIVDAVSEVVHINTRNIDQPPLNSEEGGNFIKGIGKLKDRLIIILDTVNLLDESETENLQNMVQLAQNISSTTKEATKEASV